MNKDVGAITKRGANGAAKTGKTGSMGPSRRFVAVAFALVTAWVPVVTLFAVFQALALQRRTHEIADTVLTSVRLVGRLENEVEKKQTLIDEHILATDFAEMASLEARLAMLDQQIAVTTQSYEPWATLPGERTAWDETRADLKALDAPISRALAFSRRNQDVEARKVMQLVAGQFAAVGAQFDKLISINDQGAAETLAQFSRIQLRLRLTLLGMGVISLAGVVLVWRWAAQQVGRREAETAREAKILEEQNRELDAFAGRVAHDIRNPLMAINVAATQLTRKVPEETRAAELLQRGIHRMETLIDDLLTLARVETQVNGVCDPAEVAVQVQQDFAARVEGERGNLRVVVEHAVVSCSEGLLRQALTNLTENAVKYRRPDVGPEVEISGTAIDDGYELRVSDNGVGMAADEAGHVFEPFYRSSRTQSLPGTGLGLSIVNRVAQASSGTVSLKTELGQGSTFILHLPLVTARGRDDRPAEVRT